MFSMGMALSQASVPQKRIGVLQATCRNIDNVGEVSKKINK